MIIIENTNNIIKLDIFKRQNVIPISTQPVTEIETALQTKSYPQQNPIVYEPVTEIHNGKQLKILIDYAGLAVESAKKIKFYEFKLIIQEELLCFINHSANSPCCE